MTETDFSQQRFSQQLSAYLDGELSDAEAAQVEAVLADDPAAQAEFDALSRADMAAAAMFDEQLAGAASLDLVRQIKGAELVEPAAGAPARRWPWSSIAAALAMLAVGLAGGYALRGAPTPDAPVWLTQIAEYHKVYAGQTRHLVEVSAQESDHIEAWLGKTTGAPFEIPDLTGAGLTFEGGRLLVAAGKPVAQLMYRTADGTVIALCLKRSNRGADAEGVMASHRLNGFDLITWVEEGRDVVLVGPQGRDDLLRAARETAIREL